MALDLSGPHPTSVRGSKYVLVGALTVDEDVLSAEAEASAEASAAAATDGSAAAAGEVKVASIDVGKADEEVVEPMKAV